MLDRWEAFHAATTAPVDLVHVTMGIGFVLAYLLAVTASTIAIASVL